MRFELRAHSSVFLEHADVFVGTPDAIGAVRYEHTTAAPRRASALLRTRRASLRAPSGAVRTRKEALSVSRDAVPVPRNALAVPRDAMPVPRDALAVFCDAVPVPHGAVPTSCDALSAPREAVLVLSAAVLMPWGVVPVPRVASSVPCDAVLVLRDAVPVPRDAVPVPRNAPRIPRCAVPTLSSAPPICRDALPVSRDAVPVSRDAPRGRRRSSRALTQAPLLLPGEGWCPQHLGQVKTPGNLETCGTAASSRRSCAESRSLRVRMPTSLLGSSWLTTGRRPTPARTSWSAASRNLSRRSRRRALASRDPALWPRSPSYLPGDPNGIGTRRRTLHNSELLAPGRRDEGVMASSQSRASAVDADELVRCDEVKRAQHGPVVVEGGQESFGVLREEREGREHGSSYRPAP
jgi:hypothetical protein